MVATGIRISLYLSFFFATRQPDFSRRHSSFFFFQLSLFIKSLPKRKRLKRTFSFSLLVEECEVCLAKKGGRKEGGGDTRTTITVLAPPIVGPSSPPLRAIIVIDIETFFLFCCRRGGREKCWFRFFSPPLLSNFTMSKFCSAPKERRRKEEKTLI